MCDTVAPCSGASSSLPLLVRADTQPLASPQMSTITNKCHSSGLHLACSA